MNIPAHFIVVLNCSGNANRPELSRTVPYRAVPNRTVPCSGKAPFVSLHWLPVAACIQFKTLMLAYRTTTGSAPTYFHSLLRIYIPSRSLRSASERHLVVASQRGSKSLSRTFLFTVPGCWNDLPTPIWNAGSLSTFKQQLKTHLFQHYLTSS